VVPGIQVPELPAGPAALFLDFDGTLVDFAAHPAAIVPDPALTGLLLRLQEFTCGALAIISGRTLAGLDDLIAPLCLPAAGIHGAERRGTDGATERAPLAPSLLDPLREVLGPFAAAHPGVVLEDKGLALAVHCRAVPWQEPVVRSRLRTLLPLFRDRFVCIDGARVIEVRPAGYNRRRAIEAFLHEPAFRGRRPVYLGDHRTDLDGFLAVRSAGGMAIAVGSYLPAASRLPHPAAVRAWLERWVRQRRADR
jgi:trehalose 6-phosphate phosphatase